MVNIIGSGTPAGAKLAECLAVCRNKPTSELLDVRLASETVIKDAGTMKALQKKKLFRGVSAEALMEATVIMLQAANTVLKERGER